MATPAKPDLSAIPSMTVLLAAAATAPGLGEAAPGVLADVLRAVVERLRRRLLDGGGGEAGCRVEAVLDEARRELSIRRSGRLRRVINATGVILHTGLGRSVLAGAAVERLAKVAAGYCSLEIDLESGRRGRRGQYAEGLLCRLTGAEAALIVNNNAAATMLALNHLARGREVIVSRGQLIEIGGSYRLPEVMTAGGAVLREVGTTNKTHLRDYEAAINERTAMLMHVHTSNYRVVGFSECPGTAELAKLAHRHGLPLFDDLGSGAFQDDPLWTASDEPTVPASLRQDADLVAFSGDKLLGGPQAGILLGRREVLDRLRRDPMTRALRIDKLVVAAMEATLELYESPDLARREIPILAALSATPERLSVVAERLRDCLGRRMPEARLEVVPDESFAGGGSLPAWPLPTMVVRWKPPDGCSLDVLAGRLRVGDPSVLVRIQEGGILLDLRTIGEGEFEDLAETVVAAARG